MEESKVTESGILEGYLDVLLHIILLYSGNSKFFHFALCINFSSAISYLKPSGCQLAIFRASVCDVSDVRLKLPSLMYCVAFLLNEEFLVATATQQDKAIVVRIGGIYTGR